MIAGVLNLVLYPGIHQQKKTVWMPGGVAGNLSGFTAIAQATTEADGGEVIFNLSTADDSIVFEPNGVVIFDFADTIELRSGFWFAMLIQPDGDPWPYLEGRVTRKPQRIIP